MSQFFESIKLENGKLPLLKFHEERMNETRRIFFENAPPILLKNEIDIPEEYQKGVIKLRISYDMQIQKIDLIPYQIADHRSIKIVEISHETYSFKAEDRTLFSNAMKTNSEVDDCIFVKNGLLTDATYSNLIFFNGKQWITPEKCLLKGVKRRFLLENKLIFEAEVTLENIATFSKIGFINALRDFEKVYYYQQKGNVLLLTNSDS